MGFLHEDGLISRTKSMALSLRSIISGTSHSRFQPQMQIQKDDQYSINTSSSAYKKYLQLPDGLKSITLINSQDDHQTTQTDHHQLIIHSNTIQRSSSSVSSLSSDCSSLFESLSTQASSYSSSSSGMDDMLGTESGVYTSAAAFTMPEMDQKENDGGFNYHAHAGKIRKQSRLAMMGEYPPPIPLLARTGNLPGHMPWILRRHYSNGRLILKEEKVKHHEYFEAYRENGRLILDLVPLDDTFRCCHAVYEDQSDEEMEVQNLIEIFQQADHDHQEIEKVDDHEDYINEGGSSPFPSSFEVPPNKFCRGHDKNERFKWRSSTQEEMRDMFGIL